MNNKQSIHSALVHVRHIDPMLHPHHYERGVAEIHRQIHYLVRSMADTSWRASELGEITNDVTLDVLGEGEPDRGPPQLHAFVRLRVRRRFSKVRRARVCDLVSALDESTSARTDADSLDATVMKEQLRELCRRALPNSHEIMWRRLNGDRPADIARSLNRSATAIRTELCRARPQLAAWIRLDAAGDVARLSTIFDPEHAKLLRLQMIEGRSDAEIAERLGLSAAQLKSRSRAAWHQVLNYTNVHDRLEDAS